MTQAADSQEKARSLADARLWFGFGVLSLLIVGPMSLILVLARLPGLSEMMFLDAGFPRRALIVHVNVALGVWFFVMLAGLFCLLPGAKPLRFAKPAALLSLVGMLTFMSAMFAPHAEPIRANYVPTLDHGLFLAGIGMFAGGIALNFADARLFSRVQSTVMPPGAVAGMRLAAVVFALALLTIGVAFATQSEGMDPLQYYERLWWGGGHLLQFANVLGMCSGWLLLLSRVIGKPAVPGTIATGLFGLLAAPTLAGPWLAAREDGFGWFTLMMQLGIFPAVLLLIVFAAVGVIRAKLAPGARRTPAFIGTATAMVMTLVGFVVGALISGQTTLIPAHYHISIGAVTATYMAVILAMLPDFGMAPSARMQRLAAWQPLVFGVGQVVMAVAFGAAGLERKVYGKEQVVRTTAEVVSMSFMGVGGAIALAGGLMFVVVIVAAWRGRIRNSENMAAR